MRRHGPGRIGFEAARSRLMLTRWQMRLAVSAGLLVRGKDTDFDETEVSAAAADLDSFTLRLRAEERLMAWQAAELLGVSLGRYREAVEAAIFIPVETRPFRGGLTKYYRRGDLEAGRGALADWQAVRQPRHVAPDSIEAQKRKARRAADRSAKNLARSWFITERTALAGLPATERSLGSLAFWLDLAERHREARANYAARSRRPKVVARYRDQVAWLGAARDAALEAMVATGGPLVQARIGGFGQIIYCTTCQAAGGAEHTWAHLDLPGCRACSLDLAPARLRVELAFSAGLRAFGTQLSQAAAFADSGLLDPRPLTAGSPWLLTQALTAKIPGPHIRPRHIDEGPWKAMGLPEQQAIWAAELARTLAAYQAGDIPTETLPAWLLALPHDGSPHTPGSTHLSWQAVRAVPASEVVAGLIDAVELLSGWRPPLRTESP